MIFSRNRSSQVLIGSISLKRYVGLVKFKSISHSQLAKILEGVYSSRYINYAGDTNDARYTLRNCKEEAKTMLTK